MHVVDSIVEASKKLLGSDAAEHLSLFSKNVCDVATKIDDHLSSCGMSRLSMVLIAFAIGYFLCWLKWFFFDHQESVFRRFLGIVFAIFRSLPPVQSRIEKELAKARTRVMKMKKTAEGKTPEEKKLLSAIPKLPETGVDSKTVIARLNAYTHVLADDGKTWKSGKLSGAIYHHRENLDNLAVEVFRQQLHSNPLHIDVFPDNRRCEAELVSWIWNLYNGPADQRPCGAVTTGGTESIVLAILACRNRALSRGVRWPEIICCNTAHCALEKAAEMFRIRVIKTDPVWPDGTANVAAMRNAITSSTCMIYASAPGFPWGSVDPVAEISELGLQYDVPVHVDCCLGGFIAPFAEAAGFPFKNGPVDFRNKGVTTISVDSHKYGFTPKGSSLLLYRSNELRQHQIFVSANWPGGVYGTPAISGSRSGAIVACAWAAILNMGYNGYVESTGNILTVANEIRKRVAKIPGLKPLGHSELTVLAFAMEDDSMANCIYLILDRMTAKGWHLNALQFPSGVHLACTDTHTRPGFVDEFIGDLEKATKETIENVKTGKDDPNSGSAAVYGTTQSIPDRSIISDFVRQTIDEILSL